MYISKNENSLQNNIKLVITGKDSSSTEGTKKEKKQEKSSKTIYAGNLNLAKNQDVLAEKKAKAQKQALKGILEQFKSDRATDDVINDCKEKKVELSAEGKAVQSEITKIGELRQQLKESYGIEDGSAEQKNLDLLEKSMNPDQTLTEDEMKQLANMGPLTNYQKSALQYDAIESVWKNQLANINNENAAQGGMINGIMLAKLKTHPMVDAQVEAVKIMEAASAEIVNTIIQQGKENIEDNMEKEKEDAKKQAEKKAEEESSVDKGTDSTQTDNNNKDMSNVLEASTDQEKMQTDMKILIDKLNISDEDAKGLVVDKQL